MIDNSFTTPFIDEEQEVLTTLFGGYQTNLLPSVTNGVNQCLKKLPNHLQQIMPINIGALLDKTCKPEIRSQFTSSYHFSVSLRTLHAYNAIFFDDYAYREIFECEMGKITFLREDTCFALSEDIKKMSEQAQNVFALFTKTNSSLIFDGKICVVFSKSPRDILRELVHYNKIYKITIQNHIVRERIGDIVCNFTIDVANNQTHSDAPSGAVQGQWKLLTGENNVVPGLLFEEGIEMLTKAD